jgi:hypothetical protein
MQVASPHVQNACPICMTGCRLTFDDAIHFIYILACTMATKWSSTKNAN